MLDWTPSETKRNLRSITRNDGTKYRDIHEFRNDLMDELAKGHEVLPLGKACEGFDYKTGCPGHDDTTQTERERA
jgi:hypothetical protein